ncbi:MAG TPA: GNAT family N-acetyltransferase [Allosphingosinicella sp.]|nr:GNAT family N-acetyltransferase [Allosphingosinicella sp.]
MRRTGPPAHPEQAEPRRGRPSRDVCPDHAGRGIGAWMYGEALARMKAAGARLATVGTGGDASHEAARRAYAKAGFGPGIPSVHLSRML